MNLAPLFLRNRSLPTAILLLVLPVLLLAGLAVPARAGGPMVLSSSGNAVLWSSPGQIPYNPDKGTLGALSQSQADQLVAQSFGQWAGVGTASVRFVNQGLLPVNVDASNYAAYLGDSPDGLNPIIYDSDGGIIDDLYGEGASDFVLGLTGVIVSGDTIVEAVVVLNGLFVASSDQATTFRGTLVHEFGHYIGLDHTQINSFVVWNGNTEDDVYLPTMYPTATDDDTSLFDLNPDDIAWVSELYPSGGSSLGAIEGRILSPEGLNVDGANVIGRSAADPLYQAVSCVSGYHYFSPSGFYRLPKLTPGNYTVGVDQILYYFTDGSSVGPFDPPTELPGPPEYYSGSSESNSSTTDKPEDSLSFPVQSGKTATAIDIRLNTSLPAPIEVQEKEPNNTTADAQVLTGSSRVSGYVCAEDEGDLIIQYYDTDDDIEDLYFLDLGNVASIDVTLEPTDETIDLDLIGFFADGTIFDLENWSPPTNNGIEHFGPIEIPESGAFIGVSYWDLQGDTPTSYSLVVNVVRHPLGVDKVCPNTLTVGTTSTIVVRGSGFASDAAVSFPGSGLQVNSVAFLSNMELRANVSVPAGEPLGLKDIKVKNGSGQSGRLLQVLGVVLTAAQHWEMLE